MRKSRLLLAGVAVAGAAVATTAFTAGNTFDPGADQAIVGYGEATVSGAHITAVHYNRDAVDESLMADVVWDTTTDLSALDVNAGATMTLKLSGVLVGNYPCLIAGTAPTMTITCTTTGVTFEDFNLAGLAVGGE